MAKRSKIPATPWPEGFELDGDLHRFAEEKGIPFAAIPTVWEHFENHHRAKGSLFADWRAAWRTWCLNEIKFNPGRYGRHNTPSGRSPAMDAGIQLVNRYLAEDIHERRRNYDPMAVAARQIRDLTGIDLPESVFDPNEPMTPSRRMVLTALKEAAKKPEPDEF